MNTASFHEMRKTRWIFEFLDNLSVGICRSTIEGKFVYCNQHMARIFGFDSLRDIMDCPVGDLYWDKRDRGNFIQGVIERGHAEDISLPFKTRQGDPIRCAVTARPVFDDDGIMIYLDGTVRDITKHIEKYDSGMQLHEMPNNINDLVIILDLEGNMLDINHAGAELLGAGKTDLLHRKLEDFILEKDRGVFPLFLSEVRQSGRKEAIIALADLSNQEHFIEFHAFLIRRAGKQDHVRGIARDITDRVRKQSEELVRERFQGVLEMAGGVAHKMNQPLTVLNHLALEVMQALPSDHPLHDQIQRILVQIQNLNDISAKIRGVHRYEAMDYVGGVKIVDLDKVS